MSELRREVAFSCEQVADGDWLEALDFRLDRFGDVPRYCLLWHHLPWSIDPEQYARSGDPCRVVALEWQRRYRLLGVPYRADFKAELAVPNGDIPADRVSSIQALLPQSRLTSFFGHGR